jgi:hypothetical protein
MPSFQPIANERRPKVLVLLPMAFSVRNVVYSGVLQTLAFAGVEVHLLLGHHRDAFERPKHGAFSHAVSCEPMLVPVGRQLKGRAFLNGVLGKAFSNRYDIKSYRLYRRWFQRNFTAAERVRASAIEMIGTLAQPAPVFQALTQMSELLYRNGHDLAPINHSLKEVAPDLVWSTMCASALEYPYVLAARDLGLPIVTSILSFDNLTSRASFPIYDHYLVWGRRMQAQLLRLYPEISPHQVTITGTPQFDFHRDPKYLWPRSATCERLGLAKDARYFLYAASHESLAPAEPTLVTQIARSMKADAVLKDYKLAVRLHPHDNGSRWGCVLAESDVVRVSRVSDSGLTSHGWALPTPEDQPLLISSVAHAEGCLNIVSTTSLDAAILDRPVICIDFTTELKSPREIMYEEYGTDHYSPLVQSGGLRVAHSWDELIVLMRQALTNPQQDRERRIAMVTEECGPVDGRSRKRVADTLLALVHDCVRMKHESRAHAWKPVARNPKMAQELAQPNSAESCCLKNVGA